ncbi:MULTISPECIES: nitrate ABC transporter permease [unclassified Paenibacillus]|uniref:nitrate ABC transporter permease n=1 Tax=unclassified Paenibacillus TaxID=185978 RepID=UPI000AD30287|nr:MULTISPECIES: nitrate ABC transporter permease [unclassified Paenibacillus]
MSMSKPMTTSAGLSKKPGSTTWNSVSINTKAFLLFLLIFLTGGAIWELAVSLSLLSPLIPAPSLIVSQGFELIRDPFYSNGVNDAGIGIHLLASIQRVLTGFLLAAAIAVPLGFMIGMSAVLSKAIDPFIQVMRPVSPLAWLPIGLALFQSSQSTAIFVIFISSIWPILLNAIFGVRNIPRTYLNVARTLEANRWMVVSKVYLPATLPQIVTGLRISLGVAWLVIIAAEMLIGGRGIGYFVWNEWNNLNIANIIVCIVLIGLVGIVLDRLLSMVEKRVKYEY